MRPIQISVYLAAACFSFCLGAFANEQQLTVTGKLARVMAIGGESTGWAIQLRPAITLHGKEVDQLEVAPKSAGQFDHLADKTVKVTGLLSNIKGVETGERSVLRVSAIEELESGLPPKQQVKTSFELTGSEWLLEDLGGSGVIDGVQATLTFPETKKVAGNGSCNRFFGPAEISGDAIKLGPLGATRMACSEAVMNQETKYMSALQAAERFEWKDPYLLLHCKGLEKPLRFTRKETARSSVQSRDLTALFSRAWQVTSAPGTAAQGSIYVFLANGTVLETSCVETYRIATWTSDKSEPGELRVVEDQQPAYTAVITELNNETLRLRKTLERGKETSDVTLKAVQREFVCPDLPKQRQR